MNNPLKNLKNEADKIHLTQKEKAAMRARLFGAPAPSPYFLFSFQFTRVLVPALAIVLVFGVGTASAAQSALPGDLLYGIKVSITEQVEGALAIGDEAQAQWHADVAERRIEEAQSLAAQGKLNAQAAAELEVRFNDHAQKAEELALEIEEKSPGAAAKVKARFASALFAHTAVLAQLGEESGDKDSKENSEGLALRVLARASVGPGSAAFAKAESAGSATQDSAITLSLTAPAAERSAKWADNRSQKVAGQIEEKAANTLAEARKLFDESKHNLDATTTAKVQGQFNTADEEMARGSTLLGGGAYGEATAHFTQALQIGVRLQALLKTQIKYDKNIISPLLNFKFEKHDEGEGYSSDIKVEVIQGTETVEIRL